MKVKTFILVLLACEGFVQGSLAQGAAEAASPGATGGREVPSAEALISDLQAGYGEYVSTATGVFGVADGELGNFPAVQSAVTALLGDAVEQFLSGTEGNGGLLHCLLEISKSGPVAAQLARVAQRKGHPVFVQEYVKAWCSGPLGDPYSRGKIPLAQVKDIKTTGDLVVSSGRIWLASDQGFKGYRNGHVDPGEWFSLKVGVTNSSRTQSYLSSSVRMVLIDAGGKPCPEPEDVATAAVRPQECSAAYVRTEKLPLAELSPGEQATAGPFDIALHPDRVGPFDLRFSVLVETSSGLASVSTFRIPVSPEPSLEIAGLEVDDDTIGQSGGNGNGRIEPGEKIELRARVEMLGRKLLTKVGVRARQYSSFLSLAGRNLGVARLDEKRPAQLSGDFEFSVPGLDEMMRVPAERIDRSFFVDRSATLWLAAAGCAGTAAVPKDWSSSVPSSFLCPLDAPGYRFVVPVELQLEFGQVFIITTRPADAEVLVNGVTVGATSGGLPVVFTQVQPVRNSIVNYTVLARKDGFEPASATIPVIFKDRTASNLTTTVALELSASAPATPALPPVVEPESALLASRLVALPDPLQPKPKSESEVEWQEAYHDECSDCGDPSGLALQLSAAGRMYRPTFTSKDSLRSSDLSTDMAGVRVGGAWYFGRNFFAQAGADILFSTTNPALFYYAAAAGGGEHPERSFLKEASVDVDSILLYGFDLMPGFRLDFWRLAVLAGMGLRLEGVDASTAKESSQSVLEIRNGESTLVYLDSTVQVESFKAALEIAARVLVDIGSQVSPYAAAFTFLPSDQGVDWGAAVGIEYHL